MIIVTGDIYLTIKAFDKGGDIVDIKAMTKVTTMAYSNILDKSSASELKAGSIVHIIGIKRFGIKSYYTLQSNKYIDTHSVKLIRDNDFYYENYKSRNLQRGNLALLNAKTLADAIDDINQEYTPMYFDLQRFADFSQFVDVSSMTGSGGRTTPITVGGGFAGNSTGGYNGGIISTVPPSHASNDVSNMQLNSTLGIDSNSTVGGLMKGISVGSLFDGSFLDQVANNLLDMISGFFGNKMKFVIGFSFAATQSGSNNMSGWDRIRGNWTGSTGDTISRPDVTITYYGTGGSVITSQYEQRQLPFTPVNQSFINYFTKYGYYIPLEGELLSSRNLMNIASSKYGFVTEFRSDTLTPQKPAAETEFFQRISPLDYSEVKSGIDAIRDDFNLDIDRETTFRKFNRYRVPTPNNELTNTRGHIFFTRPDLNLAMEKSAIMNGKIHNIVGYAASTPLINNMVKAHSVLTSYLQGNAAPGGDNMIPILSHCCTGIDVSDEILETVEAHESFTGWKVIYGKSNVKSKTGNTMNIAFTDDNMLSVYKILKIWTEYISAVYRGESIPKTEYTTKHILDYAISIYYFLCKENDEDILFWTKYTGCFPTATPASNFSDTIDNHIKRPTYTVPFVYSKKSDYNPLDIYEFNQLSNGLDYSFLPTYNEKTHHVHKSFMGAPFVDTLDGTHLYKLRFRAPSN